MQDVGEMTLQRLSDSGLNPFGLKLFVEGYIKNRLPDSTFTFETTVDGSAKAAAGKVRITIEVLERVEP